MDNSLEKKKDLHVQTSYKNKREEFRFPFSEFGQNQFFGFSGSRAQLISLWRLLSVKICCFRVLSSNIGRKIKQLSAIFFHFRVVVRKVTRNNENSSYLPLNWRVIMRLSKYHQDKGRLFPSVKWKIEYLFDHQKCVTNSRCTASNCNCQYV